MRMIQRGHGARFTLEPLGELILGHFDGDDAIEAGIECLPHLAHPTRSDRRKNLVRTELRTGCHCDGALFFNSAGQLTITVGGCEVCCGTATRKRWPSGVAS